MKKFLSISLMLLLILAQLPVVGLADGNNDTDIILNKVKTSLSKIDVGDTFDLNLEFGIKEGISNVEVGINSSQSFVLTDSVFRKSLENNKVSFRIKYHGGTEYQIPITLYYTKNNTKLEQKFSIDLPNIDPVKPEIEPKDPIDESKVIPNLTISSSRTVSGKAGKSTYIPVTVKNSSDEVAVDITATAEIEGDSPITIEDSGYETISKLREGKTKKIEFKVSIDEFAENKTYPVKIKFQFYNDYGIAFTSYENVYVKVEDKNTKPLISIEQVNVTPNKAQPGEPILVGLELKNNGTLDAKDIKVSLDGMSNDTFAPSSGLSTKYIEKISGGRREYIHFEIIASNKLSGGNHGLDINLKYKDGNNESYEDSNKFFVNVASNKGRGSNLIIENLTYPEGAVKANKDVTIGFNIKNMGKIDAKNIKVSVESSDQNGIVPKTVSIKKINSLSPNKSERLSFVFLTTKDAETRNYPINITVEYEDDLNEEEKHNLTQYVGVYVVKDGDDGKTVPKLIIDKYSFEPSLVKAGENFNMNLSFFNTNSQKAVRNIKIFLTADEKTDPDSNSGGGNVFTPVGSSNTFYIDNIPAKGRVEKNITMSTVPDAKAKTYTITANFEYEDSKGEQYTATELIGVPVVQQSKIEVGELNIPTEAFVGEPVPISVEFYNTGKVTLYNMMVKLEGDFQTENGNYYVGNFETGNSEYFEGMVIPSEPGELTGNIVFSYEDSTGEIIEIEKEFSLNVMDSMPMDEFPDDMPPEEEARGIKKLLKSKGFWITIVLIGAGIGGFIFYKKKKKKGMALDE